MGLGETIIIYLIIGLGVAVTIVLRAERGRLAGRAYLLLVGLLFWPLFVPTLFANQSARIPSAAPVERDTKSTLERRITELEAELASVLTKADGWAERLLVTETPKIRSLMAAMRVQAARLAEMSGLLSELRQKRFEATMPDGPSRESWRVRERNLELLQQLHDRTERELWRVIARLEELISMIYLARFAGTSRAEIEQLLSEIAATVESISAVAAEPADAEELIIT